jgi:hypothetical protein
MQVGSLWAYEVSSIQSIRSDSRVGCGAASMTAAPAPSESIQRRNSALKYPKPLGTPARPGARVPSASKRSALARALASSDAAATARSW